MPLRLSKIEKGYYDGEISQLQVCVRIRPDVDGNDFPTRFRKEMAEQLRLGNLYLLDVQPLSYIRDGYIRSIGVENEVKTRVAVAVSCWRIYSSASSVPSGSVRNIAKARWG